MNMDVVNMNGILARTRHEQHEHDDDHLNLCIKPADKPVATRTVFATQIWDVTGIAQPLLKTAEDQLSSEHGVTTAKRNSTTSRDGRESSSEHGTAVEKRNIK